MHNLIFQLSRNFWEVSRSGSSQNVSLHAVSQNGTDPCMLFVTVSKYLGTRIPNQDSSQAGEFRNSIWSDRNLYMRLSDEMGASEAAQGLRPSGDGIK